MRILLVSLNYAPEPTGIGLYSGGLAASLAAMGHRVEVVAANPHYPKWELFPGYRPFHWTTRIEDGVEVTRCPVYIPRNVGGLTRILHYLSFLVTAFVPVIRRAAMLRPDVVICVAPALLSAPVALLAARIAGAESWLHIQDFEVEAAFATDHIRPDGIAGRVGRTFERWAVNAFDRVSSISREMCAKLLDKGRSPASVYEFRNWAELDQVRPQDGSAFRDRWHIGDRRVALYSGSIARKQGIETIVDVARLLEHRRDLMFVVCGNGPTRADLERRAMGLTNIQFHDLQPMSELGELLALADVHLLPQRADAADLVLPSKLANMLASGRPVVAGVFPGRGLAREVEDAGLACRPDDAPAMASALTRLLDDPDLYAACAREAAARAHARWSREQIIGRFAAQFRPRRRLETSVKRQKASS